VAAVALFWCYLLQSRTFPADSDGSGAALQGWDMLHGDLLLRGWWLADVSFSTFEVPVDALAEAVHGLNADVVHVGAALVYAALVLVAALLARGTARGREGVIRAVLAAGIVVAPALNATNLLLGAPDHIGVAVPIMLTFLVVDRARARWWVPVAVCVLLVWAQLDDPVAEFAAAAPVAVICLGRAALALKGRRGSWRYDAALGVAGAASYELTEIAVHVIRAAGGYSMRSLATVLTIMPVSQWGSQLEITARNALLLFGADYWEQSTQFLRVVAYVHLAGVALAVCGVVAGIVSLVRRGDRVTQILTVALVFTLGSGVFLTQAQLGYGAHDIAVTLPFGAALAGRAVGPWLSAAWRRPTGWRRPAGRTLLPLLGAVLACYLAALGYSAAQPAKPAATQALANWLEQHHLTSGLGRYWTANVTTLASGGQVRVAPVEAYANNPYAWVAKPSWYNPAKYSANFVIAGSNPANTQTIPVINVVRAFGQPAREYRVGGYVVMVYDKNLLSAVRVPVQPNPDTGSRLLR
jgi:hypothetical protein